MWHDFIFRVYRRVGRVRQEIWTPYFGTVNINSLIEMDMMTELNKVKS